MVEQWSEHSLRISSKTDGGNLDVVMISVRTKRFAKFFTATGFTLYGWVLRTFLDLEFAFMIQLEDPSTLSIRVMQIYCSD
ncbi:MAG: hypothetical protein ACTSW8_02970 [Candidatus Thorarchaeota archaeon]